MKIQKKVHSIDQRYFLINRNIQQIHFKVSRWLDWLSIHIQSIERQIRSIERNSRLVEILINLAQTLGWLNRFSTLVWLIEKEHSIDRRKFLIGWNSWNWIFQNFHQAVFNNFSWTNNHHMNIIDWVWDQNWIPLML